MAIVTVLGTACRHSPRTEPAAVQFIEGHCWWSVFRSALPLDTVAVHFERAFATIGLTDATLARTGDTVRVQAGPSPLARGPAGALYEARVVAFQRGDSTHFRHYVGIAPPPAGWAQPSDSANLGGRFIPLCGEIGKAAAVSGSAPPRPDGEETLTVWRNLPGGR